MTDSLPELRRMIVRHRVIGRAMKSGNPQHFKVKSYLEVEVANLRGGRERPPRSAKLVTDLVSGSSPGGGGDYRIYLLSTNRERSSWILWLKREDPDGKPLYYRIATGRPYRGYQARFAAEQLLIKSWQTERGEREKSGYGPLYDLVVFEPGLLTKEDVRRIRLIVFGEEV